jgi:hypothetical protein
MLDKDQELAVEGGSVALQAGRDIVLQTGPSIADVTGLCDFLWKSNFPVLQEEARRVAEENVKAFASELNRKLEELQSVVDTSKFADPDVQATINDAVKASARKGEAANPSLLASLITERVCTNTDDYMGIVFSEAVQVVPRLTPAQISLLSLVIFVTHMGFGSLSSLEQLEKWGKLALSFAEPAFGMPDAQKRHVHYAGAAMVLGKSSVYATSNLFESKGMTYASLCDGVPFSAAVRQRAPSYAKILDQYIADKLVMVTLNSVGQAIALANISRYFGRLDYGTWLNSDDMP